MTAATPGILILAAGKGTRYIASGGSGNKLLARLDDQTTTVIETVIAEAKLSGLPVALVTRPEYQAVQQHAAKAGVQLIVCDSCGSGETIAAGVAMTGMWSGWIIALGDMPWIAAEHYQQVWRALEQGAPQVRLTHDAKPGHPVGFNHAFADALRQLRGDEGARSLLHPKLLLSLPADVRVQRDIDSL
ncbi:nucleotidyltransferase family protein [Pantoea sp. USHLN256]|uniref:nucleotidyltransferase family protein n=1 Tax=Pantoea sp. USHLN256 TaxID=3081293 RepID=UPI0030180722